MMEIWRTTLEKKIYAKLPNSVEDPELLWSTCACSDEIYSQLQSNYWVFTLFDICINSSHKDSGNNLRRTGFV